jgi:hypothetical protein
MQLTGSVFRRVVNRPLPPGTEIIERKGVGLARWHDARGKTKSAPVAASKEGFERIRDESGTFSAEYRDGNNDVVEVPTGCREEAAARQVLAELEREAGRVIANLRAGRIGPTGSTADPAN